MAKVRSQSKIALGLANSGIAALLLPGGRTVHSRLKVPIDINELSVCNISKQSSLALLIRRTNLLVWDEVCMSNKHVAECVDRSLRDICSSGKPFGGKVVVFGGDFRQIQPVIKHGSRAEVVSYCLNRSYLWRHVKVMKLTINMRLQILSSVKFPIRLAYYITINKGQEQSLETVGLYLPSLEDIFSHGQLYVAMSRVKNSSGLKITVCGTDKTKTVSIKNVVYREIFDPHSQIEPMEDIDEICSLLNETFPSSQLTITSPLLDTVTSAKRESVLSGADGKGTIIKLNEFNDNTLISLEPTYTRMDTECVFDFVFRNPLGRSEILPNSSFNNFTIEMRLKLAQSLGIDGAFILPVREIHRLSSNYYSSLKIQLIDYFGVSISLCSVKPDGNCLYHALSHLILGNQEYYDILKNKLIANFVNSHNHHFNVMRQSSILNDQELQLIVLMQILPIGMFGRITYIANWKFPYSMMQSLRERSCVCYTTG